MFVLYFTLMFGRGRFVLVFSCILGLGGVAMFMSVGYRFGKGRLIHYSHV